ncbi:MAG: hypothetical protein WC438_00875 [Candidatus Pacearchaeota archaeon]
MKKREIKAQQSIGMSFGTIFSIIIIIFIVVIAFIAINYFLDLKKCTQLGLFKKDLQEEINRAWHSEKSESEFKAALPSSIKAVCFANFSKTGAIGISSDIYDDVSFYSIEDANMFFYPSTDACDIPYQKIENIDLDEIVGIKKAKCFDVIDGQISIIIKKERNQALVSLN